MTYAQERENARRNRGKRLLRFLAPCMGHMRAAVPRQERRQVRRVLALMAGVSE